MVGGSRGGAMAGEVGKKHMLLGAICCGAGIAANAMTYSGSASTQELTYVLAWGAIIFGGIQIIRGAFSAGPSNQA
jgi:hypothetical protein